MTDTAAKDLSSDAWAEHDITSELYRIYTYANGAKFRISGPATLYIKDGSHRIVDTDGVTHRPSRDWVGISWKPRSGKKAFEF